MTHGNEIYKGDDGARIFVGDDLDYEKIEDNFRSSQDVQIWTGGTQRNSRV